MKLKHQLAAGAALIFLIGCSQDQPMGGDKGASASAPAYTNEAREPAKSPAPLPQHSASRATNR